MILKFFMEKDNLYIQHILDAISTIESYIVSVGHDAFLENKLLQDGIVRELEIIGEASKQLSHETKEMTKEIPWKEITGMRDMLIHEYFGVDKEEVWKTATADIQLLKSVIADFQEKKEAQTKINF